MSVLRTVFGPSQGEIWRQLSEKIGATFVDGGFFHGGKVVAHVQDWTLTLDTYTVNTGKSSVTYTRMRAPFVNADGFFLQGIPIGQSIGLAESQLGEVRELIAAQPRIRLEVVDDEGWFGTQFPDGVDELRFHVPGVLKNIDQLRLLFDLFAAVLNRLCAMGSAYARDPGVEI